MSFRKPEAAESFLAHLNWALSVGEEAATTTLPPSPTKPVFLIVGAPRTGTTLLLQWLARSGQIAAPTNLLARFFGAPYLGGLVQRLLTDPSLGYRGELVVPTPEVAEFTSTVGKTDGILGVHEFFYFWRQFFPVGLPSQLSSEVWEASDRPGFSASLAALESSLARPVALKAIILQYNISQLAQLLPTAVFLSTRRDEVETVQSLLKARRLVSSEREWFSVQPPGFESVLDQDPLIQVAAQVAWTNDVVAAQLAALPAQRYVVVDHAAFSQRPEVLWEEISRRSEALGHSLAPHPAVGEGFVALVARDQERGPVEEALAEVRRRRT